MISICNEQIRYSKNGKDWIDESNLVKKKNGKTIDWKKSVGKVVRFGYYGEIHYLEILDYIVENGKYMVLTKCNELIDKTPLYAFKNIELARVLGDRKHEEFIKRFSKDGLSKKERNRLKAEVAKYEREQFKVKQENEIQNILKEKHPKIKMISKYETVNKKIELKCAECNHTWWNKPRQILNEGVVRCPACSNRELNNYDGRNAMYYTHPYLVRNLVNIQDAFREVLINSDRKIKTICRECGYISDKSKQSLKEGFHCEKCDDGISYPNKFIYSIIDQLSKVNDITEVKREFRPEWGQGRRYDIKFKYNNINYIIEMDGGFHYVDNSLSGKKVKEQNRIDKEKDMMARINGYEIIRIDCNYPSKHKRHEYIKNNIINSEMFNVFDLKVINWKEVEEFAVESIAVKVWRMINNEKATDRNINERLGISKSTIHGYIRIGKNIGVISKRTPRACNRDGNVIYVFKHGELAYDGYFSNGNEIVRKSLEMFGEKLQASKVHVKLKEVGEYEHTYPYKGYTFVKIPYGEDIRRHMDKIEYRRK